MPFDSTIHNRHSIRYKNFDYSNQRSYFITICAYKKQYLFGTIKNDQMITSPIGQLVNNAWNNLTNHYSDIILDQFILMPNHIHGIIRIRREFGNPTSSVPKTILSNAIRKFKSDSAIACNKAYPRDKQPLWQRNYYERIIRSEREYYAVVEYIHNNPRNWMKDTWYSK